MNNWEETNFWYRCWQMHIKNRDVVGMRQAQFRYVCYLAQEWAGVKK